MLHRAFNKARRQLLLVGYLACLFIGSENLQASIVTIQTKDGRELMGQVDVQTNEECLWIRREENRIVLTTAIFWSSISTAQIDGNEIKVNALVKLVPQIITTGKNLFQADLGVDAVRTAGWLENGLLENEPEESYLPIARKSRVDSPVVLLEIKAYLVNLDRDVEPDGLKVLVTAVDAQGRSVPVRGNLQARLWGIRDVWQIGRVEFDDLQRWSEPVHPTHFDLGAASYTLRFRNVHPEQDWELMPYALLNVRLGIYGQGNYEASLTVPIRQFQPFRDRMQHHMGSRYFRQELTQQFRRRN